MKKNIIDYKYIPVKGRLNKCFETIKEFNLKNKILVDVGCSNGWLEYKLKNYKLKNIIAIDPNKEAIEFAKDKIKKFNFFVSPANSIPANSSSVDVVVMFDVIEHVKKNTERQAFKENYRVLKNNGTLFLSTPNNNLFSNLLDPAWYLGHRHYDIKKISKLLTDSGFKIEKVEIVGRYWSVFYMLWFYVNKWLFNKKFPRNKFLEEKDNNDYQKRGFVSIFIECRKI